MKITFLGHAGLFIETSYGSILCDPWFNPAYFASWFPFPSNEHIESASIGSPTYLYLSHMHYDHFDPTFLRDHVSKEATVLLPDFPLNLLERALRNCGFTKFILMKNGEVVDIAGLRFMIVAMGAPMDGPLGDSALVVDDHDVRIFNQNDARVRDIDVLKRLGHFDAHFLQYSGAIWYPMAYQFPARMSQALGRKKRENEMARALQYVQHIGASFVFPSAGPPCFLDDPLFAFNDFDRDPANTFPDQTVFLEYMQAQGLNNGRSLIPGSVLTLTRDSCAISHPLPAEQVQAIFTEKRAYLTNYKARQQTRIDALKRAWPRNQVDILSSLQAWFEPLLEKADLTCAGINGRLLMDCDKQKIVIDFQLRRVYAASDHQEWDYRFHIDPTLVEYCILHHAEDWVNELFLSCRFEAERKGPYNEFLYVFFKSLSPERVQFVENYYAQKGSVHLWETEGYRMQRNCPHMKADLSRFGHIDKETGVLTCMVHGWQFDLATGRCLTTEEHRLFVQPISSEASLAKDARTPQQQQGSGSPLRDKCHHCWFAPSDIISATSTEPPAAG